MNIVLISLIIAFILGTTIDMLVHYYTNKYSVQKSQLQRKKIGGVWYFVWYIKNTDSVYNVVSPIKKWTQCDKPKGFYFEILKTENYL